MLDIQRLLKEKREAFDSVKALKDRVTSEDRLFSQEEENMYKTLVDKMNECQRSIEVLESMNDLSSKMKENVYDVKGKIIGSVEEDAVKQRELTHKWMRLGAKGLTPEELRVLKPVNDTGLPGQAIELRAAPGGLTNPTYVQATDVVSSVLAAKKYYGGWLSACDEFTTDKANTLNWPTVDDTSVTGSVEAAGTSAFEDGTAITLGKFAFTGFYFSSQGIAVNNDSLLDSDFDMGRVIGDILGERLWRAISTAATSGTGTTTLRGLAATTASAHGASLGVLAGKCTITRARLLQLMGKVDYAYHLSPGCGWMMNSAQMYEIAGLASSTTDNRPLWQPSMVQGVPDKLEGFPYWVNNDLTAPTTYSAHSRHILFGDFKHYKIRYVGNPVLLRLTERYAELLQTGFIALQRLDSVLIKPNTTTYCPVKYLRKLNT
jgi:HK97 family phage major capsid protein